MLVQALSGIRGLSSLDINTIDEQDLLNKTLSTLNQNLDFESCSIFLLQNNDELHCLAGIGQGDKENSVMDNDEETHTFKLGQGIIGQAAITRQLYHCKDCKQDKNYLPILHSPKHNNIGSIICVPIITGGELLGVLNVSHPQPFFFHSWQEHVFSIHADIFAQMLHNQRLMKDMVAQVNNRTKELQHSLEETKILKSKYQALSFIDDLTQIYNRRYFFSEVPAALARALRYQQSLSIFFIDLDNFKSINDHYGHEVGDVVLKNIAAILSKQLRKGDILARIGGEEFALAVPNTDNDGVRLIAERIKESVAQHNWGQIQPSLNITLSIGITNLQNFETVDPSTLAHVSEILRILVREADQALYYCKKNGRDMISFYQDLHNERD